MAFCNCGRLSWDRMDGDDIRCPKCLLGEAEGELAKARDKLTYYHHKLDMHRGPSGRLPIMLDSTLTELKIEYLGKKIGFWANLIHELKKDYHKPAPELCGPYDPYVRF